MQGNVIIPTLLFKLKWNLGRVQFNTTFLRLLCEIQGKATKVKDHAQVVCTNS